MLIEVQNALQSLCVSVSLRTRGCFGKNGVLELLQKDCSERVLSSLLKYCFSVLRQEIASPL